MAGHLPKGYFDPYISFLARVEAFVTVDAGCEQETYVGPLVWLMKHVHIGHDASINQGAQLAPGVTIGGYATIGQRVKIGINACVLPYITVGHDARIGAGAVVTKHVPSGQTWVGNPARHIDLIATNTQDGDRPMKCGCDSQGVYSLCAVHGMSPEERHRL